MRHAVSLCCALAAGAASCSSSAGTTFDSGLPPDQSVNALRDSEVVRICERAERFFVEMFDQEELERLFCIYGGINAVRLGAAESCDAFVDGCVASPPFVPLPVTAGSYDCESLTAADLAACENSVGEIEDCLNQIGANYDVLRELLTCSLVDDATWMEQIVEALDRLRRSSCASLDPDCPFAPESGPTLP